ncbi:MAG: hypothetical protein Q9174_003250 [Haloplaca sp. 1 TL-2023]
MEFIYPPLPPQDLGPRPSLLPFVADHHLAYMVPVVSFWLISLVFHYIDTNGFLSKYKLHTSAEDLTKNRASRRDVIKFALIQQAAQCTLGYFMADGTEQFVSSDYAIAAWARTLRYIGQKASQILLYTGLNLPWITYASKSTAASSTFFPRDSFDGLVLNATESLGGLEYSSVPFSPVELLAGKALYWVLVPIFQYLAAMVLADTFQYFTHRAFHVNKWLYKHIHYMHHDIYVPFAYGAFYNHPLETIPIDGIGFPICLAIAGLDSRQAAFFGAIWTFKTVVDHCGYDFPYNPCNIVCPNSVLFHDLQ